MHLFTELLKCETKNLIVVALAIEQHCCVESGGYSGIKDVYNASAPKDDVQQSFYLLFRDTTMQPGNHNLLKSLYGWQ